MAKTLGTSRSTTQIFSTAFCKSHLSDWENPTWTAGGIAKLWISFRLLAIFCTGCVGGVTFSMKWLIHSVAKGKWHIDRRFWRLMVPMIGGVYACVVMTLFGAGLFAALLPRVVESFVPRRAHATSQRGASGPSTMIRSPLASESVIGCDALVGNARMIASGTPMSAAAYTASSSKPGR